MYWKEEKDALYAEFKFKDFREAFAFMTQVALLAESVNHHPEMHINWNVVQIRLYTHDKGNRITEKDMELAKLIEAQL